jgi:phosphate uptake regulator
MKLNKQKTRSQFILERMLAHNFSEESVTNANQFIRELQSLTKFHVMQELVYHYLIIPEHNLIDRRDALALLAKYTLRAPTASVDLRHTMTGDDAVRVLERNFDAAFNASKKEIAMLESKKNVNGNGAGSGNGHLQ